MQYPNLFKACIASRMKNCHSCFGRHLFRVYSWQFKLNHGRLCSFPFVTGSSPSCPSRRFILFIFWSFVLCWVSKNTAFPYSNTHTNIFILSLQPYQLILWPISEFLRLLLRVLDVWLRRLRIDLFAWRRHRTSRMRFAITGRARWIREL